MNDTDASNLPLFVVLLLPCPLLSCFSSSLFSQACTKAAACQTGRRAGSPWETSSRSPTSTWGGETSESATGSFRLRPWSPTPRLAPPLDRTLPLYKDYSGAFIGFKCQFLSPGKWKRKGRRHRRPAIINLFILPVCVCVLLSTWELDVNHLSLMLQATMWYVHVCIQ